MRPSQIDDHHDRQEREWIRIYQIYQDACDRAGLVDFAEILLRSYELFLHKSLILQRYQHVFSIFWWMSFKTPIKFNMNGFVCWRAKPAK